ncbi:MAG: hypothetical protein EZS28_024283 [Streblomastix strix]|uniref:Armadillo-type fold n=1 Tax=Streblomastix strix TaxID=222440 RepID=A0A5J4VCD4_9EUKA|nr:MAG: hypothetical protein EZS28_024283 [Streblomastix strix]
MQNAGNRAELLKQVNLNDIANDLKQPIEGNEDQKEEIQKKQQQGCNILQALLNERDDDELRRQILNLGIIDSLLNIYNTLDLEQIDTDYIKVFLAFINPINPTTLQLTINKKSFPALVRLLERDYQYEAILLINNILQCRSTSSSLTQMHPYYDELASIRGIEKIYNIFKQGKYEYKQDQKIQAAISLGYIFKARSIGNAEMKIQIIKYLKESINYKDKYLDEDQNLDIRKKVKNALRCLFYNSENRDEIEKDGFTIPE